MIAEVVRERTNRLLESTDVTAERVLVEVARIAFSDITNLFDENGTLRPLHSLTVDQSAAIASLDLLQSSLNGRSTAICRIRMLDKIRALEMLMKHLGMFSEKLEHEREVKFSWINEPWRIIHEIAEKSPKECTGGPFGV